jgi:adenosyl cobinamide kinase/adenosyl cobinamide phosphate guanylyltransferase
MSNLVRYVARQQRCIVRGPADCGKSLLAEQALLRRGGNLEYLATLERSAANSATIRRHEERRDARWTVHELVGEPDRDLAMLDEVLRGSANPVLFDGFAIVLARLGYDSDGTLNRRATRVVEEVRRLLRERTGPWILVDPVPRALEVFGLHGFAQIVSRFHAILAAECRVITLRRPKNR